ncbi:MAG: phosphoribosylformylglycinamidine synthase subunit PurS, partial [Dehalococcoidia bacterium]
MFRVEVSIKAGFPEPRGEGLQKDIQDLGITTVEKAKVTDIYLLEGSLNEEEVRRICRELLVDPVVEEYSYGEASITGVEDSDVRVIEVAYNPGVMDPVEESVKKGILDLGIATVDSVKTAKSYYLWGELSEDTLQSICDKLLVNSV